jgi:hypothetical protein
MKKQNFEIVRHPEVKNDLQEAIDYYNDKKVGLGDRFYLVAYKLMKSLEQNAFLYTVRFDKTRFLKVGKFPYIIYYYIVEVENTVYIDAVKSTLVDPDTNWNSRDF